MMLVGHTGGYVLPRGLLKQTHDQTLRLPRHCSSARAPGLAPCYSPEGGAGQGIRALQRRCFHKYTQVRQVLESTSHDPFVNLAYEQYLFGQAERFPLVFLYRNTPSIVIGRNQNPWLECDVERLPPASVQLVRRFSGGGAVFHDLGNVNYTFFTHRDQFQRDVALSKICAALRARTSLDVALNERHDLLIHRDGRKYKCSGSAFKISKDRSYSHGTMLLSSDLQSIRKSLRPAEALEKRIEARGVESVRSPVANLHISLEEFRDCVLEAFEVDRLSVVPSEEMRECEEVIQMARTLSHWDWIYGQTPEFAYESSKFKLRVRAGRITSCEHAAQGESEAVCHRLVDSRFDPTSLDDLLNP